MFLKKRILKKQKSKNQLESKFLWTYKEIAIAINRPKAARAVANACAKNPYAPKVPCHRVIKSDGTLGGFSSPGGTKTKKKMLRREGFSLKNYKKNS